MFSVIIVPDGCRGPEEQHRLEPGQTLRFGRTAPADTGLTIPHPGVPHAAGEITATGAFWILTNFSRDQTYDVRNPEGAGERIRVAPGRADAPVAFEFARVTLRDDDRCAGFDVLAPRHDYLAYPEEPGTHNDPEDSAPGREGPWEWREDGGTGLGDPSPLPFPLDRTRRYFLVLAALCEPRLRGDPHVPPPTVEELVGRLRPVWPEVEAETVVWNVGYLGLKLRLPLPGSPLNGRFTADAARAALVAHALRFDLVHEDHLGVLERQLV